MGSRVLAQRYELIEKIGEGGMAVVFKAYDRMLGRNVALKILRPEYTKDEAFIESFKRESQLVAGIVDPNIVQVYDVGQENNIYYIVMELVEGEALSDIIKRVGPLNPKVVVDFGQQIAKALATAHKNNLIHRDIKPHNVLVTTDGVAKLTDFGIAKRNNPNNTVVDGEKEAVMGSIHYFSPEQARGNKVDERSDIYSLGIVMYEMATGKVPYDGENAVEVAVKHMNEPMVPPSRIVGGIPQDLEDIIMKATAKDPDDRYANAEEMITGLSFVKFSRLCDYYDELEAGGVPEKIITKNKKNMPANSIIAFLLVLAIPLAGIFFDLVSGAIRSAKRTVEVPDIIGKTLEEATAELEKYDLKINIVSNNIINDQYGPNTVVETAPVAHTVVKPGQSVRVKITRDEKDPVVPNLVKMEKSMAISRLESMGYTVGATTEDYSSEVPEGCVIATKPVAGAALKKGESVDIVISLGEDPKGKTSFKLNLVGKTLDEAKQILSQHGCSLSESNIEYIVTTAVDPGCVAFQSPSSDTEVEKGTVFVLHVRIDETINPVALIIDLSSVKDGETYTLTIDVADKDNPDGTTQYGPATYKKEGSTATFTINGRGTGTATVKINDTVIQYSLDFNSGSSSRI